MTSEAELPAGYRRIALDETASTNAEALSQAQAGAPTGLWITARTQSGGRGRGGRVWTSPPGNLYASLLLRLPVPPAVAQQLTLLAPVVAYETARRLLPDLRRPDLRLKWPNDVLLGGAKICGILIESVPGNGGTTAVIGWGLNLTAHPASIDQLATDLAEHGSTGDVEAAFRALATTTSEWLTLWDEGRGLARVRQAWIDRAGPIGERLSVRQGSTRIEGTYAGLDDSGALLLHDISGKLHVIVHGDVALTARER